VATRVSSGRTQPARLEESLRDLFGFDTFNPGQEEVVARVMRREIRSPSSPPGREKACAISFRRSCLDGTTIVVSPLIALMKDQLDMLAGARLSRNRRAQFDALGRSGSGGAREDRGRRDQDRLRDAGEARRRAVHRDPQDDSHSALRRRRSALHQPMGPRLPAGLSRARASDRGARRPTVLALTATATPAVREDILIQLGNPDAETIVKGFDRPNLRYEVIRAENEAAKLKSLKQLFEQRARRHGHHLHRDDQERARGAEVSARPPRPAGRRLSFEAAKARSHVRARALHVGSDSRRRRDQRVRPRHRQAEHPLRDPLRSAGLRRSVHAGGRSRGPRRRSLALHPTVPHERYARAELFPDRKVSRYRGRAKGLRHARVFRRPSRRRLARRPAQDLAAAAHQTQSRTRAAQEGGFIEMRARARYGLTADALKNRELSST
jgi:hypothetical protein